MTPTRFSLPLVKPLSTAHGEITERQGFVVRIDHRDAVGIGEATPLGGWTESLDDCERALESALATLDGSDQSAALLEPRADEAPAARHGLTTALLDADARAEGVSLARWLDPDSPSGSVPVNATIGDGSGEETVTAARDAVERGYDCLKVKIGARDPGSDLDRVAAVRSAIGDDVCLRVDANGAWDRQTATEAIDRLADLGVAYVEQPLPAADLAGHGDLRGRGVEIAVDESLRAHTAAEIFAADAADVVILKPMAVGGPGDAHTLAMRAREAGIEPVVTTTIDGVVARTAAVHVAAAIPNVRPCGLATADYLTDDLGSDPAPVNDGRITVPDGPGLGIDPSEVRP